VEKHQQFPRLSAALSRRQGSYRGGGGGQPHLTQAGKCARQRLPRDLETGKLSAFKRFAMYDISSYELKLENYFNLLMTE
jgi:hypothetical protein